MVTALEAARYAYTLVANRFLSERSFNFSSEQPGMDRDCHGVTSGWITRKAAGDEQ